MTNKTIADTRRDRLRLLIAEYGTQVNLAREVGIAPAQISQWINAAPSSETGKPRAPSDTTCRRIEKATDKPFGWMDQVVTEKDIAAGGITILEKSDIAHTHRKIPMYRLSLSAGTGNVEWVIRPTEDPLVFRERWFLARHLSPNDLRGMTVKGDSMEPALNNGDTVIIDITDTVPADGEIYAVMWKEQFFIKKIRHIKEGVELVSLNPAYDPIVITFAEGESFRCLGRMVWRGG